MTATHWDWQRACREMNQRPSASKTNQVQSQRCPYPECNCPLDIADPKFCARGLKR
ncbi:hypothetical protein SAMN05444390_1011704 [Marinobacterium lutimaris]|uniref:Uncharacterized protein n=1 Tax=Marinobacterium lutimaris TaxID=568106 RepID=A0A1H5YCD6_9GAMM|nr:hypothetical protein SAMN05444390_1011704 [Marinobacterium lutimaris]